MDELLETEAIEMPAGEGEADEPTARPLPATVDQAGRALGLEGRGPDRGARRRRRPGRRRGDGGRRPRDARRLSKRPSKRSQRGRERPVQGARQPLVPGRRPPARQQVGDGDRAPRRRGAARGRGAAGVALPAARRGSAATASLAAAGWWSAGCWRPTAGGWSSTPGSRAPRGSSSAPAPPTPSARPRASRSSWRSSGCGSRSASTRTARSSRARFRGDPLIGEIIHHRPWLRPRRRPWPWEALAWAVTEQLIEVRRAVEIQRRSCAAGAIACSPTSTGPGAAPARCATSPAPRWSPAVAPAELAAFDLAPSRAIALIRCAREVAAGRVDPGCAEGDRRLARISGIGPWTLQVLGFSGRGEPDSLPAGDLAYVKLVGSLAGLGRRATVAGGRGVLRPLRAVPRPRRQLRARPLARRGRPGPAAAARRLRRRWRVRQ